jgi:hypothetical protein
LQLQYNLGRNKILDVYADTVGAVSLRQLKTGAQYAIRIRRDSDNSELDIGFTANGNLDTGSLLSFVTGSAGTGSGFVQTWYDQSGNSKHYIQTTNGSQPIIVSSGSLIVQGNRPAILFTNDFLNNTGSISATYSFTISRPFGGSTTWYLYGLSNSGYNQQFKLTSGVHAFNDRGGQGNWVLPWNTWTKGNLVVSNHGSNLHYWNSNLLTNFYSAGDIWGGAGGTAIGDRVSYGIKYSGYVQEIIYFNTKQIENKF